MRAAPAAFLLFALPIAGALADDTPAPKRLTADDLAVETHKWDGKLIQSTVICFYADTDDYRCAVLSANGLPGYGTTLVRIDFSSIEPPEIKKAIEDNCDTVAKMQTKACRFQAVFTYEAFAAQENASGSRMMEIAVKDSAGVFSRTR